MLRQMILVALSCSVCLFFAFLFLEHCSIHTLSGGLHVLSKDIYAYTHQSSALCLCLFIALAVLCTKMQLPDFFMRIHKRPTILWSSCVLAFLSCVFSLAKYFLIYSLVPFNTLCKNLCGPSVTCSHRSFLLYHVPLEAQQPNVCFLDT